MTTKHRFILPASLVSLILGGGITGPSDARAGVMGEGLTHYYDFETTKNVSGGFTISGKKWDAGSSQLTVDDAIQLSSAGSRIGGPATPKKPDTFGNAFSGGGTGVHIFEKNAPFLRPTGNAWTIAFWVMRNPNDPQPRMLVNGKPVGGDTVDENALKADSPNNQGFGFYKLGNNKVGVRLSENTGGAYAVKYIISRDAFSWGTAQAQWRHIALVRDGAALTLYVAGAKQGGAALTENSVIDVPETKGLYTAKRAGGQGTGNALDDLAIWNRALTPLELATLSEGAAPISTLAAQDAAGIHPGADLPGIEFTDPDGWTNGPGAMIFPAAAKQDAPAEETSYAFDDAFTQVIGGARLATVASVTGGVSDINIWGVHKQQQDTGGRVFNRDIFLDVRGGAFGRVSAGFVADWQNNENASVNGCQLTQLAGAARADWLFGAGEQGGRNPALAGNAGVVVKDAAVVLGSVVGGWTSQHNGTPIVAGDTAVLIQNVQAETDTSKSCHALPAGLIIGGSAWAANTASPSRIDGNTSVTIDIPANTVTGPTNFVKTIIGGSRSATSGDGAFQTVNGNASVTITAPPDVTFTGAVYAGGRDPTPGGNGTVSVKGRATLTLNGGTFKCRLDGGIASGGKTIVFNGTNVFGPGAVIAGFDRAEAGPGAGLRVAEGGSLAYDAGIGAGLPPFTLLGGTVTVTGAMTPARILNGETLVAAAVAAGTELTAITNAFRGKIRYAEGAEVDAAFTLDPDGTTVLMGAVIPESADLTHTPQTDETEFTWDKEPNRFDGGTAFRDFDNVAFRDAASGQTVSVAVPDAVVACDVEIGSGLVFTGAQIAAASILKKGAGASSLLNTALAENVAVAEGALDAGWLAAGAVAVSNGAAFRADTLDRRAMRFLRLSITKVKVEGDSAAVSELRLFRKAPGGYERVEWPADTILTDNQGARCVYKGGYGTMNPRFEGAQGNEELNALIDGIYTGWGGINPYKGYTPNGQDYWNVRNKWSIQPPAVVTIEFPETIPAPDGYNLFAADADYRDPQDWTVEISPDGADGNWTRVSRVDGAAFSQRSWSTANGGGAGKPAFLFDGPAAEDIPGVTVAEGGAVIADGDWAASLTMQDGAILKATTNRCLTLKTSGPEAAKFGTDQKVTINLTAYNATTAGKHYILAGDAADWPAPAAFNVTGGTVEKDNGGYFVEFPSRALVWTPGGGSPARIWKTCLDETPWTADGAAGPTFFRDNDKVAFGDLGGGLAVVDVSGTVKPAKADFTATDGTAYLLRPAQGADAKIVLTGALTVNGLVTNRASCAIGGPVTLDAGGTIVLDTGAGTEQTVSGKISGAGKIVKAGEGTASLTAKNDATGDIEVNAGQLILDAGTIVANQPFTSVTVAPGATLRLGRDELAYHSGCTVTNAGLIETASFNDFNKSLTLIGGTVKTTGAFNGTWKSACYNGVVKVTGGKESFLTAADPANGNLQHQVRNGVFNVDGGSRITVDAVLADGEGNHHPHGITKTGPGAMAVNRPPLYTGPTAVNAGTYEMNAAQTKGGAYTVAPGAVLAGTGSIASDIALDGTIVAGLACNNITMNDGSTVDARVPGSKLAVSGTPAVATGETVKIDVAGRTLARGETLISWGEGKMPGGRFTLIGASGFGVEKTPTGAVVISGGTLIILR